MTFIIRTRGAPRPVTHDFLCPEHGPFTALVDSADDTAPCPRRIVEDYHGVPVPAACAKPSPWSPQTAPPMRMRRVEATRGNHDRAEHKGWLDTSNLEEGQDFSDWQADREAVHEELRKDLVMEMVRSDR